MLCWIKLAFKQIQMSLSYTPQYSNAFDTMYAFGRITLFLKCKLRYMKVKQKSCKPKLYLSGGGGTTICNLCNKWHKGNVNVFSTNASENYIYIIYLAAIETRFPYERAFFKEHCRLISLFRGMPQKAQSNLIHWSLEGFGRSIYPIQKAFLSYLSIISLMAQAWWWIFTENWHISGPLAQTLELLSSIYKESRTLRPTVSPQNAVIL